MEIIYLSQSPQTGQVYFNCRNTARWNTQRKMLSQSPQTGQVYFNRELIVPELEEKQLVSIPSNGSSLFQQDFAKVNSYDIAKGLNPLKRVKFISITRKRRTGKENGSCVSIPSNGSSLFQLSTPVIVTENSMKMSLNPLKRVKFISIQTNPKSDINSIMCLNPLKRVKFISMELTGKFPEEIENYWSQSPQTGQVYFNLS